MFLHNLKIAFRNILKYKTQSVISMLGLAIGFTAFAFTMSWIRYEMGYDSHNPDADRIYCVVSDNNAYDNQTSYGLTEYLRNNFSEVEAACNAYSSQIIIPDELVKSMWDKFVQDCRFSVYSDTAFFSVFYPDEKIKFPHPLPKRATVFPRNIAEKWNISPDKFGQNIDSLDLIPIAIVEERPLPSNVAFGWLTINDPTDKIYGESLWNCYSGFTYIRLHKRASVERIRQKLDSLAVTTSFGEEIHSYKIYPLRKAHLFVPNEDANIKFEALKQFAIVALLVIICALLNYIMLFISRVKIRSREFALNKVSGASNVAILRMLLSEFILILLTAIFIGGVLTELLFPAFSRFSMIIAPKSYFLVSLFWYSLIIILATTLTTFILVYGFVHRNIRENISPEKKLHRTLKINFSHISIFIQLCIGILLIFSTAVVLNQYNLMDQRVGYNRNGIMAYGTNYNNIPVSEVKKIVGMGDFIVNSQNIFSWSRVKFLQEIDVTDNNQHIEKHSLDFINVNLKFRHFLEIPLLEGRDILPSDQFVYFINETGNRVLGNNAVGKIVNGCPIIGVIPDLQVESALVKIVPTLYGMNNADNEPQMCSSITFRCKDDRIKKRVFNWFMQKFPSTAFEGGYNFYSMDIDKHFKEFTKSERNLLFLIGIMTAVAILIAIFGIYSMITLSCAQRRKEIAIRKVNGARMKEILALFARQYFVVTLFACIAAFPIGIYVMQRWLEQYTRRVSMEWWIFAGIVLLIGLIVFASIFFRVYRAAKENPAEVVKSE